MNGKSRTVVATSHRPLVLAEHLSRDGAQMVLEESPLRLAHYVDHRFSLGGFTPVVLDGVTAWWDSVGRDRWPDDRLEPFPRLPWPQTWAEWQESEDGFFYGVGLMEWSPDAMSESLDLPIPGVVAHASGFVSVNPFVWRPGLVRALRFQPIAWAYDASGQPILYPGREGWQLIAPTGFAIDGDEAVRRTWKMVAVWRLFTALLGVRNIRTTELALPRSSRRQLQRASAPPWVRYKTLCVDLPSRGASDGTSHRSAPLSDLALHLVRGHLADYRQGPGLFGKYRTMVWVPMHTRGSAEHGAVAKVYDVNVSEAVT